MHKSARGIVTICQLRATKYRTHRYARSIENFFFGYNDLKILKKFRIAGSEFFLP